MGSQEKRVFRPTEHRDRAMFVWMWVSGVAVRDIAIRNGTSATTVYRWIRRWQREGNVDTRPRTGRPRNFISTSYNKISTKIHCLPTSNLLPPEFLVPKGSHMCSDIHCSSIFPSLASLSLIQNKLRPAFGAFSLRPEFQISLSDETRRLFVEKLYDQQ